MISASDIEEAKQRITSHILNTPLIHSKWLSDECNGEVYLKLESEQHTGSFKARGSLNKLMWLKEQEKQSFPVTASSGNHALGFARALDILDMQGKVFLPNNTASTKVKSIQKYDVETEFYGNDYDEMEEYALQKATENDWCYVSPYNDKQVIAGQGTMATEITEKVSSPDNILATVGGGGLISGIATYMKEKSPETKIIGGQPENSPEMSVSVQAGEYQTVDSKPTLSDGSAGGFESDAITLDMCKSLVDDFILVSEEKIRNAIYGMIKHHGKLVEGAAAVAVASVLKKPARFSNQTTVIIICGANISPDKLHKVLNRVAG